MIALDLASVSFSIACMCPTMVPGISVGQADRMASPALLDVDLNSSNLIEKVNSPLGEAGCTGAANPIEFTSVHHSRPHHHAAPRCPQPGLVPTVPERGDCALAGRVAKATTNAVNANSVNLGSFTHRESPKRRFVIEPGRDTTVSAYILSMRC